MERKFSAVVDLFDKATHLWMMLEEDQIGPTLGPRRGEDKRNYPGPQAKEECDYDH
jgi:hypothetical protein